MTKSQTKAIPLPKKAPGNKLSRNELFRQERKMILSGQAMFKRDGKAQLVIYPHEVAEILKLSLRSAQRAIKKIRQENGKPGRVPPDCL